MPETIISDTSCFILLTKIDELALLHQAYDQITTTYDVAAEFGMPLPDWVNVKASPNDQIQKVLELQIDKGEASAIALALLTRECTIILDDHKARKVAERLGLRLTGTVGVIVKAKLRGVISSVKPYLHKINRTNFRLTKQIEEEALKQAGENS